jgi:predicted TIM-barrel fold metal-dependent hydrolase
VAFDARRLNPLERGTQAELVIDFNCRLFDGRTQANLKGPDLDQALQRWFDQMAEQGPEHIVAQSFDAAERDLCVQAAAQSPKRLSALGAVDPRNKSDVAATLSAIESGFLRGICLYPTVQGWDFEDAQLIDLLEQCRAHRPLVVFRLGLPPAVLRDAGNVRWNMTAANPIHLVPLADRFPELVMILPSFGGGFLRETLMAGELAENVHLDTSHPTAWLRTHVAPLTLEDVLERCLGVFGSRRLLFATGSSSASPGWRGDWLTLQREAMGAIELDPHDRALILGGNAHRLLFG